MLITKFVPNRTLEGAVPAKKNFTFKFNANLVLIVVNAVPALKCNIV